MSEPRSQEGIAHDRVQGPGGASSARRIVRLGLAILLLKAISLALVAASPLLLPGFFSTGDYEVNPHWPEDEPVSTWTRFKTWDAQHYIHLSEHGYRPGERSCAFFPLWPIAIRAFSFFTLGNHLLAGLILANAFSLAALLLFHGEVEEAEGTGTADAALALVLAYPGAIFFQLVYSESIFFLLTIGFFAFLRRGVLRGVAACAFLLPLARPVGIFIVFPLAVHLLRSRGPRVRLLLVAVPILGYASFLIYMHFATGNAFEAFDAQDSFQQKASIARIFDLPALLRSLAGVEALISYGGAAIDRLWFFGFLAALVPTYRRDKVWFAFLLPMGLVPAAGNAFVSYTRCLLVVFPVFVAAARVFERRRRPVSFAVVLAALGMLQVVFLLRHVNNLWAN